MHAPRTFRASAIALRFIVSNHTGVVRFVGAVVNWQIHATVALMLFRIMSDASRVSASGAAITSSSSRCARSAPGNRMKLLAIIKSTLSLGSGAPLLHGRRGGGEEGHRLKGKGPLRPMYLHPPQVPGTPVRALGGGAGRNGTFPPASHVAARNVTQRKQSVRLARALSRSGGVNAHLLASGVLSQGAASARGRSPRRRPPRFITKAYLDRLVCRGF